MNLWYTKKHFGWIGWDWAGKRNCGLNVVTGDTYRRVRTSGFCLSQGGRASLSLSERSFTKDTSGCGNVRGKSKFKVF
jgi:hypothetical protein